MTARFADCCVVRAPLSRQDNSDHGTRPVSLAIVTLLRVGPEAEVVDELVAVRSWIHGCIDRRPRRDPGSLGGSRSDCIVLYDLNDFLLLARLTLESEAMRALAWHDEMVGPVRLPRPVFVVSLAASYTDMPLHHPRA